MEIFPEVRSSLSKAIAAFTIACIVLAVGCGDTFRPVVNPIFSPSGDPALFHLAFVVNKNAPANAGAVSNIDVSGDTSIAVTPVGVGPVHAAFLPPGESRIFIANRDQDTVTSFIPSSSSTPSSTLNLAPGSSPVFLATTESSRMYVANSATGTVGVIAAPQNTLITEIPVGSNPSALAETPDGKKLYAVNQGSGTVSVIDTGNDTVITTVTVGSSPVWALVSADALSLYVLNQGSNSISVINTTTDVVTATVPVGNTPNFMHFDRRLSRLYVSNTGSNSITVLNASATPPVLIKDIPVAAGVTSVAALSDGTGAYAASLQVGSTATMTLSVINALNNTVSKTISFPSVSAVSACSGTRFRAFVAAAADGSKVYLSSCDAGVTHVMRTSNNTLVLNLLSPPSANAPPSPGAQPPPQNPVFILAGP